jgi:hypothetical protein
MSRKVGIPSYRGPDVSAFRTLEALKIVVEQITGVRGGTIMPLDPAATLPVAVAKINEIIVRLNAS